jgi:hypothetical protein
MLQIVAMKFLITSRNSSKSMAIKSIFIGERQPKIASSAIRKDISRKTVRSGNFSRRKNRGETKSSYQLSYTTRA